MLTPIGEAMAKPDADLSGKGMTWWLRVSGTGMPISRREVAGT
jgi:hypothetical protein